MSENLTKICGTCGEEKPTTEFYLVRSGRIDPKIIPQRRCKACVIKATQVWQAKNYEKFRAAVNSWAKKNSKRVKLNSRRYYLANREEFIQKYIKNLVQRRARSKVNAAKRRELGIAKAINGKPRQEGFRGITYPMKRQITCPHCQQICEIFDNPKPVVDIIIELPGGIVLIKRKNLPFGWAIPGGFVDYGESVEAAAAREAREETGLELSHLRQFHVYSDPARDQRVHAISTVFIATGYGRPQAGDDAADIGVFTQDNLPPEIAFDHPAILADYFASRESKCP